MLTPSLHSFRARLQRPLLLHPHPPAAHRTTAALSSQPPSKLPAKMVSPTVFDAACDYLEAQHLAPGESALTSCQGHPRTACDRASIRLHHRRLAASPAPRSTHATVLAQVNQSLVSLNKWDTVATALKVGAGRPGSWDRASARDGGCSGYTPGELAAGGSFLLRRECCAWP
jgi:hypothetical protein